jgi:radical SAM superfamily enzyme YgiQ (UPF0313 family)
MKRFLLIKPPFQFIPIGMGYVLSCLHRVGVSVDFLDMNHPNAPVDRYLRQLAMGDYMAVGTGGFVYGTNWFREMLAHLRSLSPQTPIILGGNITRNVRMDLLLEKLPVDFAVVGEAESSLPHLLGALEDGRMPEAVPGVAFRSSDGQIVRNAPRRLSLQDEDFLPAYDRVDLQYYIDSYRHHVVPGLGRMMPVLTGRGCKGGCSFCSPTVGRFMPRKIDSILHEIELWNSRFQFEWITFATEIFFDSEERILEFCREYKKMGVRKPWSCCFRMDQSPELLPAMKDAGCVMICAGLESGSEDVLPRLKRGCTVEQFKRTLDAARRTGLVMDSPFMMTNEDETEEDLKKTIDFVIDNKMDANFGLVGTYPGTPIYQRALRKGLIGDEWDYITNRMKEWAWRSPTLSEASYFNISAIPSERVLETVYRQVRRYYTFQHREFRARDVSLVVAGNGNGSREIGIKGHCFKCGTQQTLPIRKDAVIGVIEYFFRCPRCHQKNFLDFTNLSKAKAYYDILGSKLRSAERILVLGTGKNAMDLYFYDLFGLDLSRIAGFVDLRGAAPEQMFYHLPRYRLADIERVDHDAILVADVPRNVAELLLSTSRAAQSKPVYHLAPSKLGVESEN